MLSAGLSYDLGFVKRLVGDVHDLVEDGADVGRAPGARDCAARGHGQRHVAAGAIVEAVQILHGRVVAAVKASCSRSQPRHSSRWPRKPQPDRETKLCLPLKIERENKMTVFLGLDISLKHFLSHAFKNKIGIKAELNL